MIHEVEIIGFQAHEYTALEFCPGINVIVGNSDEGKSSILRAIRWACRNKPLGEAFINWGFKNKDICSVTISFGDDYIIRRKSKGGLNEYITSGTDEPFKALRDVPEEVLAITRMNDINFQKQREWFMLDKKPGDVAKSLNDLSGLGIVDKVLEETNSRIRKTKSDISIVTSGILSIEKGINEIEEWFPEANKDVIELIKISKEFEALFSEAKELAKWFDSYNEVYAELDKYAQIEECRSAYEGLKILDNDIESKDDSIKSLRPLIKSLSESIQLISEYDCVPEVEKELKQLSLMFDQHVTLTRKYNEISVVYSNCKEVEKLIKDEDVSGLDVLVAQDEIDSLYETLNSIAVRNKKFDTLADLLNEIISVEKQSDKLDDEIDKLVAQLKVCPECGRLL